MRKDEPEIIPFPLAKRKVPYDQSGRNNPYETLIPFQPPFPVRRSSEGEDAITFLREEGLHHLQTLQGGLERFLSRQEEHSHREDVSLEGTVALFSPRFKAYFTRPDGGGIYVSHDELKTPAGVFKGQGLYLPTLPPHPRFSRFRPLHDGGVGVIIFTPARAYDPTFIASFHPLLEYSPPRACTGSSLAKAFPLTAEVSMLQEGRVTVLGEAYKACLFLPERDA